ncbi:MAG: hypothetical protein ABIA59_03865 [Candidatus Latescibacterota bacterium]
MKKVLVLVSALLILALGTSIVSAQNPFVQVYFSHPVWGTPDGTNLTQCPPGAPGTVLDSLYVIAHNFNMWMSAIEYQVLYPATIFFLSDNTGAPLNVGNSSIGIATAWPLPQNAFTQLVVNKVLFIYMCQFCYEGTNIPIDVVPHPDTGFVRAVRWPDNAVITAQGMRSLICGTTPVEETTWGNIKALYE